jgi:signal peptidase I
MAANMIKQESGARRLLPAVGQIVVVIVVALLARTVAAEAFYVPSGSMQPTLLIGDELVVSKFPYGYSRYSMPLALGPSSPERFLGRMPQRGDVVVFRLPSDPSQTYVKRVVGVPGDRIQMRDGRLWINGSIVPLRREGVGEAENEDGRTVAAERYIETLPDGREHPIFKLTWNGRYDNTPVFEVTPGHVFVMGDNRDNSADSRIAPLSGGVGLVPVENLVGRVEVVLGSWDLGMAEQPIWTWPSGLRLSRFFSRVE